jgi:diguanylate cyclase (GGDEF)-like protein/PAS domain S-box-containing protein
MPVPPDYEHLIRIIDAQKKDLEKLTRAYNTGKNHLADILQRKELQLVKLLQNSTDIVLFIDQNLEITYISPSVETIIGYTQFEMLNSSCLERIHKTDRIHVRDTLENLLRNPGGLEKLQYRHRHSDSTWRIFESTFSSMEEDGNNTVVIINSRDITDQNLAQDALRQSEETYRTLFNNGNDAIFISFTKEDGSLSRFIEVNNKACQFLSIDRETLLNRTLEDLSGSEMAVIKHSIRQCLKGDCSLFEMDLIASDGATLPVEINAHPFNFTGKQAVFLIARDIRQRRETQAELDRYKSHLEDLVKEGADKLIETNHQLTRQINEKTRVEERLTIYSKIFENTIEGILITDLDGGIQTINPAFSRITGYSEEEIIGKNPAILKSYHHDEKFYASLWDELKEKSFWRGEIWNRRKNGEVYPQWMTINTLYDNDGNPVLYVAVFTDIKEYKVQEEKMKYRAYHDPLTGLPNRLLFFDRLKMEIAHAARDESKLAVLFLDLDRFKQINDTLGHVVGDYLLKSVAKILVKCIREVDTVTRMGGDEFTFILPQVHQSDEVVTIVQRIFNYFQMPLFIEEHELYITPSIGISIYPDDGDDVKTLLKSADMAMYQAKEKGRNNYQFYTTDLNKKAMHRLTMENYLRFALKNNSFTLVYQPQVEIATGHIIGFEALIRLKNPQGRLINPDTFISTAMDTGLIVPIGEWVLQQACNLCKSWIKNGIEPVKIAVNIAAQQFHNKMFVQIVEETLKTNNIPPGLLELELTENSLIGSTEETIRKLSTLREFGVYMSIDDFGTGYSSFNYLKKFAIHKLKIDKSFITDIPGNINDAEIAVTIIRIAHTLNLQVIAEGVENQKQLKYLQEHDCDQIQGFYFSKAVTREEATAFLKQKKRFKV